MLCCRLNSVLNNFQFFILFSFYFWQSRVCNWSVSHESWAKRRLLFLQTGYTTIWYQPNFQLPVPPADVDKV